MEPMVRIPRWNQSTKTSIDQRVVLNVLRNEEGLNMIKKVKELNGKDFKRYGSKLDWTGAKLSSTSENHDYWDGVSEFHSNGDMVCSYLRIKNSVRATINEMECHRKSEEILVAVEGDIVVHVALPEKVKDVPDESTIECFYVKQGRGILLKPGVWHALPCTLSDQSSMTLVIFKKYTSHSEDPKTETDIRFSKLKSPYQLEL
jgi:ureidoglycolate hydrolase